MIRIRDIIIDNRTRTITYGDAEWVGISLIRWKFMLCLILGGGMTAEEMFDNIYGHRADGGPVGGREYGRIAVHYVKMKKFYQHLGLKLYRTRKGEAHTRYELIPEQDERGCR